MSTTLKLATQAVSYDKVQRKAEQDRRNGASLAIALSAHCAHDK